MALWVWRARTLNPEEALPRPKHTDTKGTTGVFCVKGLLLRDGYCVITSVRSDMQFVDVMVSVL